ncbi:phosphatase [Propionigenium maris DSM 9537]|uniref:Phosphatase n=1 Tax=Propionigenium maris DSM 9537 TaxID=1123000 RepID=A0A9W6GHP2_9FUSO|nr:Cof-type HAD-IIB family hydrolase [Propionigenium maris]GLI55418.1 phosphatase [Propionigenium maris DSM 9537]
MYKLVVFDIDGTLAVRWNEIPETTLETIRRLKERGIHCLMATGRGSVAVEEMVRLTGIEDYVALNGQYIFYGGRVTYKYVYPKEVTKRIAEICREVGCYYGFINERGYYIPDLDELRGKHGSPILTSVKTIDDLGEDEEVNQIVVFCEKEKYSYFDELKKDYIMTSWHTGGFDMHINTRSKAEGVREIAEDLGIGRDEILCFGDGENDIELLEYAGMGVAMGSAGEKVKKAADLVTEAAEENGIYNICRKLGMI